MGYSSDSSRIQRATTASVRYTPRAVAALLGARVRAAGAWLAERVRVLAPGSRTTAAAGVQTQRERSALPAQVSGAAAGHALEIAVETGEAMSALSQASSALQRLRQAAPASRTRAASAARLQNHFTLTDAGGDLLTDDSGDTLLGVHD